MTAPARDRGTSTDRRRARGRSATGDATAATAKTGTRTRTAGGGTGTGARRATVPSRGGTSTRGGNRSGAGGRAATAGTARPRTATAPDTAPSRKRTGGRAAAGATLRDRVLDWPRSRSSFVLVLMALMIVGVAATLWLSTQAIADSWRLQELREGNTELTERVERLQREVGQLQSPSSLAERAEALGMVPAGPAARLVEDADGDVTVVGDPEAATPPPDGSGTAADGAAGTGGADDGT